MSEIIQKPWGYEEILSITDHYVVKRMVINAGHRMSLQYHNIKEETIYVISGCLIVEDKTHKIKLMPGCTYHVKPKEIHRFGAEIDGPVVLLECSTTELHDVVRLEDDYSRD